jgi:hypothetical protein
MQPLEHACIFCTSNPKGRRTYFSLYVVAGNSSSFTSSLWFLVTPQIPYWIHHSLSSIAAIPVRYLAFSVPLRGYTNFLWSSNIHSNLILSLSLSRLHASVQIRMVERRTSGWWCITGFTFLDVGYMQTYKSGRWCRGWVQDMHDASYKHI